MCERERNNPYHLSEAATPSKKFLPKSPFLMRIIYFLPNFDFFRNNKRGRTSHAHGFISGLRNNEIDYLLVCGPGYDELYDVTGVNSLVMAPKGISRLNFLWVAYCAIHMILNKSLNNPNSVLVVRYSTSKSFLTSFLFGSLWKGKTVYEINSLGYHQIATRFKSISAVILAVEKSLVAAFDFAVCVSQNISLDVQSRSIRTLVLPNGSSLAPIQLKDIERENPRFIYLGAYQPYYDFDQLFRCFLRAKSAGSELHVYGDKDRYILKYPQVLKHRSIKLKDVYDLDSLLKQDVLSRRDCFILPNGRNRMSRIGSPTKLFEYLSFGGRIIYQDYGQASDILVDLTGVFPYKNDRSLIQIFQQLAMEFNHKFESPVAETEYLATYTWDARVKTFRSFLESQ